MYGRRLIVTLALAVTLAIVWALPAIADDAKEGGTPAAKPADSPASLTAMPVFVPPNRGSPMTRLGGATRGASTDDLPRIEALVPEESGWTLESQPVLYWYLSKKTDVRIDLVLFRVEPHEVLIETTLPKPQAGGVQRIALADHGAKLEAGQSYQWLVKLVPDPENRDLDQLVGGGIDRVAPNPELEKQLESAQPAGVPAVLASAGIWYDAIDLLSQRIARSPSDAESWNQRAALFQQVGLPEVEVTGQSAAAFTSR